MEYHIRVYIIAEVIEVSYETVSSLKNDKRISSLGFPCNPQASNPVLKTVFTFLVNTLHELSTPSLLLLFTDSIQDVNNSDNNKKNVNIMLFFY